MCSSGPCERRFNLGRKDRSNKCSRELFTATSCYPVLVTGIACYPVLVTPRCLLPALLVTPRCLLPALFVTPRCWLPALLVTGVACHPPCLSSALLVSSVPFRSNSSGDAAAHLPGRRLEPVRFGIYSMFRR